MSEPINITDTDRVDWIAQIAERTDGTPAAEFRPQLDERILADRAANSPAAVYIDLAVEFPPDDVPVRVVASDRQRGVACFDSHVLEWYVHLPNQPTHGRLWSEVFGPHSVITQWQPNTQQP